MGAISRTALPGCQRRRGGRPGAVDRRPWKTRREGRADQRRSRDAAPGVSRVRVWLIMSRWRRTRGETLAAAGCLKLPTLPEHSARHHVPADPLGVPRHHLERLSARDGRGRAVARAGHRASLGDVAAIGKSSRMGEPLAEDMSDERRRQGRKVHRASARNPRSVHRMLVLWRVTTRCPERHRHCRRSSW